MAASGRIQKKRNGERGISLYLVAASLFILLGISALAIDLASLYVARNEAQRAADSAALAGAKVFVESGCINSGTCAGEETDATTRAVQVGNQNILAGQNVSVNVGDVSFNMASPQNPQITVTVQSGTLNTFFAAAFGITNTGGVNATATAEAYTPSGTAGGPTFCTSCVRPWLIPNCDPNHLAAGPELNMNCPNGPGGAGPYQDYLLDPNNNYAVANPGCVNGGGAIGEPILIAVETQPTLYGAVDDGTGLVGYQTSITTCNTGQQTCGSTVNTITGSKINFTVPGIDTLLHLPINSVGAPPPAALVPVGQDYADATVCPLQIHAGALNPLVAQGVVGVDSVISTSDSIVTAYIFDSNNLPLAPGSQPVIHGFAQIFVSQVDSNGDVWGIILSLAGCGNSGGSCSNTSSIKGPTTLPVRLIHQAS
jgi:hypothetical protein